MPYRIDLQHPTVDAFDTLVDLGALDVEAGDCTIAALMPDSVAVDTIAARLGVRDIRVSEARGRDDESVWTLSPRTVRVGRFAIAPPGIFEAADAITLGDGPAFGTGLHPTTALCLEAIDEIVADLTPARMLDVGTGSGILAFAALRRGVNTVVGLDVDRLAIAVAAQNARLNTLDGRFLPVCGEVHAVRGSWPLVVANIRAAELIEMAPALVRRVASRGSLILSGIAHGVVDDVSRAYRRCGVTPLQVRERDGWTALVLAASW